MSNHPNIQCVSVSTTHSSIWWMNVVDVKAKIIVLINLNIILLIFAIACCVLHFLCKFARTHFPTFTNWQTLSVNSKSRCVAHEFMLKKCSNLMKIYSSTDYNVRWERNQKKNSNVYTIFHILIFFQAFSQRIY